MTDQLGSPRVITNSDGQVVSRRDFAPFGEELYADTQNRTAAQHYSSTGDDGIRKRFTGYEKDMETGLDFAEARMYENRHARFTAVDPLLASGKSADPQSFNRYVYVMNNPLVLRDPTGLQAGSDESEIVATIKSLPANFLTWMWRTIGYDGKTVRVPDATPPYMVFEAPDSYEYLKRKQGNAVISAISPGRPRTGAAPYGTKEDVDRIANGLSTVDQTGTFNMAWTGYKNSIGQASNAEYAGSIAMFGATAIPGGSGAGKVAPRFRYLLEKSSRIEDGSAILYRGVELGHFGFENALKGIAVPKGGHRSAYRHNLETTFSVFTSWTTDPKVAIAFAKYNGIVLRAKIPFYRLKYSPDKFEEFEVCVKGIVEGAETKFVANPFEGFSDYRTFLGRK